MNFINRPFRISASSYSAFSRCSMQFKWSAIDEIEPDMNSDNLFAVLGSAFHKAMELNDKFNIDLGDLKKSWKVLFLNFMSEAKYLEKDIKYDFFMNRGYQLLRKGLELKKRWQMSSSVIFNEKYFRIPFNNSFVKDVFISGKIDLAIKNNDDDIYTIIDWKTGKNVDKNIEINDQITIYIHYISQQFKIDLEKIFGALVYPQLNEVLFTQRTSGDIQRVFKNYNAMLERVAEGDFKKEPLLNKKKDDCIFCPFIKRCKKHEI